ncbi:hypothetical protein ACLB2K_065611 [Fragaria x ananassa]
MGLKVSKALCMLALPERRWPSRPKRYQSWRGRFPIKYSNKPITNLALRTPRTIYPSNSGIFYVEMAVGTPATQTYTAFDTLSPFTWLQVPECQCCFSVVGGASFDPQNSSSFTVVSSVDPICSPSDPFLTPSSNGSCSFDVAATLKISFGCGIYNSLVFGGDEQSENPISGVIYGTRSRSSLKPSEPTPAGRHGPFYVINVTAITVNGAQLGDLPTEGMNFGIDSMAPYTAMSNPYFQGLRAAVVEHFLDNFGMIPLNDTWTTGFELCYDVDKAVSPSTDTFGSVPNFLGVQSQMTYRFLFELAKSKLSSTPNMC